MDIIVFFVPLFIGLIILEWGISKKINRPVYRFNDTVNDLSLGITSQIVDLFCAATVYGLYYLCYDSYHLLELNHDAWWVWVCAFLGADFSYYWFHRTSHERNFAWAVHVPHHQSEEYNFSVALRQGAIENFVSIWFRLPFAFLGIPPEIFLTAVLLNIVFQFFVHTRLIKSLGPLEWFMNTPSHHRVHHACNPKYLDKNYAGMFIIWDRMFGSFVKEEEEPTYGLTHQLNSWDPLWAQTAYFKKLIKKSLNLSPMATFRLWFLDGPTAMGSLPNREQIVGRTKYDSTTSDHLLIYVAIQFIFISGIFSWITNQPEEISIYPMLSIAIFILMSIMSFGAIFEAYTIRWYWETTRNLLLGIIGLIFFQTFYLGIIAIVSFGLFIILNKDRSELSV
jgi:alkylglycerol monooxygenase